MNDKKCMCRNVILGVIVFLLPFSCVKKEVNLDLKEYNSLLHQALSSNDDDQRHKILFQLENEYDSSQIRSYYQNLAQIYFNMNDFEMVIANLEKIEDKTKFYYLGTYYIRIGEVEKGEAQLSEILLLDPNEKDMIFDDTALYLVEKILGVSHSDLNIDTESQSIEIIDMMTPEEIVKSIWQ
jgi:tetratricopeptide (TPR) repeat protein